MKIIIISTYIPQKCGIATYSNDLYKSLIKTTTNHTINIIAVTENGSYKYPSEVVATIFIKLTLLTITMIYVSFNMSLEFLEAYLENIS